ncbi:MAG TPA: crotonase/enoyl-CoA hydratase family protein [Rhodobiaceae bacterium]|nr:MAG: Methylthioacryloyl-CoA hydratase [Rhodobiaceae bacterium UBA7378]HCQ81418.1 crotonase/enoyl-CoA hydratase family protein [Rhodobiaceae bacterium]|tara:strand:+ start:301 stop:1158 length:858 start_codon:yes stop_codon:yes gene_type:complete
MKYECFDVSINDNIAHIVLNRPEKRNNMNAAFWDELPAIVKDIDTNARARVIVISSTGPHFCGGLDVSMFANDGVKDDGTDIVRRRQSGAKFMNSVSVMQDSFSALEDCRLPVLAAIQGGCIGGGVDLVTACDMRYATQDAFVTIYETKIGMTADVGTFPRIVKLVPEGLVREMAYTGRRVSAEEARDMGLVNRVYDTHEAMLAAVMEIAREIAENAPLAVYGCKKAITYARDHTTQEGLEWIGMWNASMLQNDEIMEAMVARKEARPAEFVELPSMRHKIAKGA